MIHRPRMLVVDDEEVLADLLQTIFENEGWETLIAKNGTECLRIVRNEMPDLVVLDIIMPKMDGFEVLCLLRERSSVPVIILSALGETADVVKCLNIGANDYIRKPFAVEELLARIRKVLCRSQSPGYIRMKLSPSTGHKERQQTPRLNQQERDIIRCLFEGLSNKEIGRRVHLSSLTVRNYVCQLLLKFRARNRTELLTKVISLRRYYHRRLLS